MISLLTYLPPGCQRTPPGPIRAGTPPEVVPVTQTDATDAPRILCESLIGRLGTCLENEPYVVPISFVWHEGSIYFHSSADGRKYRTLVENPRVCLEVDEAEFVPDEDPCRLHFDYRSAIAWGRARVVSEDDERLNALRRLCEKYAPGSGERLSAGKVAGYDNLAVIAIDVDALTTRQNPPGE